MRRALTAALGVCLAALALGGTAAADPPPGPYFNGFEQNTAGWFNFSSAVLHREQSGYVGSGYASGIPSADGNWHARLDIDNSPGSCLSGAGVQPVFQGVFTNWGGFSSIFPTGGYTTRLDIYLDTVWASTHFDRRWDWSSAVNTPTGQHRRDFVFNVGTEPGGFVISASNNGTRCGAFPANPGRLPVHVIASDWYTFEHTFTGVAGGPLIVVLRLIHKATQAVVGTWVLSDPTDIIGVTVGGNRYGWFIQNEIEDLAIDNAERTGLVSTPGCDIKISDGGWITALNGDTGTFGGNAKVSESREESGQQTYHDHGPLQPFTFKAETIEAVICDDDGTAEIHGRGTVDGEGDHEYRIRLVDGGEPGVDDVYGILIPSIAYFSGDQPLEGGNIQIRRES